ncbi:MAG: TIGR04283 family arsenosugar biosynthesis glycosyltransferase [Desulfobacterales bacterium]
MAALAALGPLGSHLPVAMLLYGVGFILLIALVRCFPATLSPQAAWFTVVALGLAARLLFIPYPPGNDIFRYIWEGHVQNHGINPYLVSPDSPSLDHLAQGDLGAVRAGVNHSWLPAAYPPAALLIFRLMAWFSPSALFFKAVFVLFDLGVMAVLARLLAIRGLPASRLLFYAANPLVIVFTAGQGHLDVVQAFFLCLACLLFDQRRAVAGGLSLGLAAMSKYLSVAALPFLLTPEYRWKNLAVLAPLLLFLPFLSAGQGVFGSLFFFGSCMHYNDSIAHLLRIALGPLSLPVLPALLLVCLLWVYLIEDDRLRAVYLSVGCLLLFLPTLHPWYLLLVAPFLCFFPSGAWLYLQAATLFTFPVMANELTTGVFYEIGWHKAIAYAPFYGLLVLGLLRNTQLTSGRQYDAPNSISVIIPTFNEAAHIGDGLSSIERGGPIREVIVADGGSTDGTAALARSRGVSVVECKQGRGAQIRAAARIARGDVVLVLHADSTLLPGAAERLMHALAAAPEAAGGCFGMTFADRRPAARTIAWLNNLKAALTGISFGDQAQFCRRAALEAVGGFPGLMLMEDVELSLRLKAAGRLIYLGQGVRVSGRRWKGGSFLKKIRLVLGLFFRYLFERRLGRTKDGYYYLKYYGRNI